MAVALGADALGFVFAPGSPRQVIPETVAEILHRLPAGVITVGVFRDETKERVVELVNTLGLGGAQLHGREPLSDVRWIRKRVPFVIQALRRRRSRARRGRQRPGRHRAGRRRCPRFGHRVRLGARRRGAAGRPPAARRRTQRRERRPGDPARTALGGRRGHRASRPHPVRVARTPASSVGSSRRPGRPARSSAATVGCPTRRPRRMTGWPTARDSYA